MFVNVCVRFIKNKNYYWINLNILLTILNSIYYLLLYTRCDFVFIFFTRKCLYYIFWFFFFFFRYNLFMPLKYT